MRLSERYGIIERNLQEFLLALFSLAVSTYTKILPPDIELCIPLSSLLFFFFDLGGFSWDVLPLFPCGLFLPLAMVVEAPLSGAEMIR